jgi:hypothetical protein
MDELKRCNRDDESEDESSSDWSSDPNNDKPKEQLGLQRKNTVEMEPAQFIVDNDKDSLKGDESNKNKESPNSSMEEITKVNSESGSDEPGVTKWSP